MPIFDDPSALSSLRIQLQMRASAVAVVAVAGDLDQDTSPQVQQAVNDLVRDAGVRHVLMDLGEVTFLGAAGVRALLVCHRDADLQGACFQVCRVSDIVRVVLNAARVSRLLGAAEL
jgi:anti-anti-sigma factor